MKNKLRLKLVFYIFLKNYCTNIIIYAKIKITVYFII